MKVEGLYSDYYTFLKLEKSLGENSTVAYMGDLKKLYEYAESCGLDMLELKQEHLSRFLGSLHEMGVAVRTQARILSGIKSFYRYLTMEEILEHDPSSLLHAPKTGKKLPDVLSIEEIESLIEAVDLSKNEGQRNRAILETLYGCGLRVSELVNLRLSDLYFNEEDPYIRVQGKGEKQRFVPIGRVAIGEIVLYLEDRNRVKVQAGEEDIVFLNRRGKRLTRVMIFTIIKNLCEQLGIKKQVSPHTFRHSFATHLVEGGAHLRAVQEMLGHESIVTTEIYTHLDRNYLKATLLDCHPRFQK